MAYKITSDWSRTRSTPYKLTKKFGIYSYTIYGVHMPNSSAAVEAYRKTIKEGAPQVDGGITNKGYGYFFSLKNANNIQALYQDFNKDYGSKATGFVFKGIVKSIIDARLNPTKNDKWQGYEGWRGNAVQKNEMPYDSENIPKKN